MENLYNEYLNLLVVDRNEEEDGAFTILSISKDEEINEYSGTYGGRILTYKKGYFGEMFVTDLDRHLKSLKKIGVSEIVVNNKKDSLQIRFVRDTVSVDTNGFTRIFRTGEVVNVINYQSYNYDSIEKYTIGYIIHPTQVMKVTSDDKVYIITDAGSYFQHVGENE